MKEEYWAEQFSAEVDGQLSEANRIPEAASPAEYREALELAHDLAGLDFSAESRQRAMIRYRLLDEARRKQETQMNTRRWRRALTFTTAAAALALALAIALFYPGGIAAAAQHVIDFIQSISLGQYSRAVQVAPGARSNSSAPAELWIIRTEIGNFGGDTPPGVEPVVRSMPGLEEAQSVVNFHIVTPAYLPEGYALREVKLAPVGGTDWAFLFYSGPAHDIILAQMPGGPQPSDDPNAVASVFTGVVTDETLERADLDGQPAVWIDGHSLMWTVGQMTFEAGGLDLTIDEAKQIARSLH